MSTAGSGSEPNSDAPTSNLSSAHEALATLVQGRSLEENDAEAFFGALLAGEVPEAAIGAALALIQSRGPAVAELTGAARVMRRHVSPVPVGELGDGAVLIDTCGTGGAPKTFNVSTAAAIVAAGALGVLGERDGLVKRVCVAKHGNRSRTGRGSAEVLAGLGVNIDASPEAQGRCLREAGVCFSFAIHHHPRDAVRDGAQASARVPDDLQRAGAHDQPGRRDPPTDRCV
jgi:anthranilate phosphoribosyltransferase